VKKHVTTIEAAVHLMLLNGLNATLRTLRSNWSTNITNASIATQVDQLVTFITPN